MANNGVEKEHSKTAMIAAMYRAIHNIEYNNEKYGPDHLAKYFLFGIHRWLIKTKFFRKKFKTKSESLTPGLYGYVLARTAFFDEIFKNSIENGYNQIVLLGAGYDSRVYRFSNLYNNINIIELDIHTTQNRKKKYLKKANIKIPDNVILTPINFNTDSMLEVLEGAGYDKQKKTLFLWEGVTMYLEEESIVQVLDFIKLHSHSQSAIAFDYVKKISEQDIEKSYGVKTFLKYWKEKRKSEPFKHSFDTSSFNKFFTDKGFLVEENYDNNDIEKKFLLDENKNIVEKINAMFGFSVISTK